MRAVGAVRAVWRGCFSWQGRWSKRAVGAVRAVWAVRRVGWTGARRTLLFMAGALERWGRWGGVGGVGGVGGEGGAGWTGGRFILLSVAGAAGGGQVRACGR